MGIYDAVITYYHTWGSHFRGRYDKLIAYGIIALLTLFSVLDTCLVWGTYKELENEDMRYALVTGHAGDAAVSALYFFGVLSSLACCLEIINILSMMYNGGHARFPVELEQAIILLVEGIPVSAINLSVVMCRQDVATGYQTVSGLVTVIKSGLRMYFYGIFKEHQFKYERSMYRWTLKGAIYLSTSVTWVMLFLIQSFLWHHIVVGGPHSSRSETQRLEALSGVSVLLINEHDFDHDAASRHIGSYFTHDIHSCDNGSLIYFTTNTTQRVVLVHDIRDIINMKTDYNVTYDCQGQKHFWENDTFFMPECQETTNQLIFSFTYQYSRYKRNSMPFGELQYSIASSSRTNNCTSLNNTLSNGWGLHYFRILPRNMSISNESCIPATLEQPWDRVCFPPEPHWHNPLETCT